ncbi:MULTISPECIES: hypothetical protein [unclassified Halomonas]|uniref:hypothetical protein n=1 Tax=unclassified Halomonas TaxID=2609666 RepID=UPI0024697925|nr:MULTISPECIES: hypothetical protein [unclassified Halomonas]
MIPQDVLKKVGILGIAFGLVLGPQAFAADEPAAKATDSAANPVEEGDLDETLRDGEMVSEDKVPDRVKSTDSAANPVEEGDLDEAVGPNGETLSEDEVPDRVKATDSAANPVDDE